MQNLTDSEIIKKNYEELKKLFAGLSPNKQKLLDDMIYNTAFHAWIIKTMQQELENCGITSHYAINADETGVTVSPVVKQLNSTIKTYDGLIAALAKYLPVGSSSKLKQLLEDN